MRPRHVRTAVAIAAGGLVATAFGAATAAAPAPATAGAGAVPTSAPSTRATAASAPLPAAADGSPTRLTLVTGDRLQVARTGRGTTAIELLPGADGSTPLAQVVEHAGDTYVLPFDAVPYIADGSLDRELFNVTSLLEQQMGTPGNPVSMIVTYERQPTARSLRARPAPEHSARVATLESAHGIALEAAPREAEAFWQDLRPRLRETRRHSTSDTIDKVWLDSVVTADLHESVPQIGAPEAWEAGYDGSGTTVAVLDTGYDPGHPDLAGQVIGSRDFTGSGVTDGHGHGTHVASTIAGTGAGSDGYRVGVAPGADLLVGKVLGNDGNGQVSWLIEGMEWATANGAGVVSMSLSTEVTDGHDPLSQAVDELTASTGTLFVAAAGNAGPDAQSVRSPGTADTALTVGAVDKSDVLAGFSSRGPRYGDYAVKPDLTAPGVDIVAARAAGTSMGNPVDDLYTSASGTSMATPHVAGAAAILLQQHPSWSPARIKDVLVGSAETQSGYDVFEQGGGRVDVGAAVARSFQVSPASVSLGRYDWPHGDDPVQVRTLTYRNEGTAPLTLDLAVNATTESGAAPPDTMFGLSATSVEVPADGTATVDLRVDPNLGEPDTYSAYVTATDVATGDLVHTSVGLFKEPKMVEVTIEGIFRDGSPAAGASSVDLWGLDTDLWMSDLFGSKTGPAPVVFRVPAGTYAVGAFMFPAGKGADPEVTFAAQPQVELSEDTTIVLDARDAVPVTVQTPRPTVLEGLILGWYRAGDAEWFNLKYLMGPWTDRVYVVPTEPVTKGAFEFNHYWERFSPPAAPGEMPGTAYTYDLMFPEAGVIPAEQTFDVDHRDLARLETRYVGSGEPVSGSEVRHVYRPFDTGSVRVPRPLTIPSQRKEWVTTGDTRWTQLAWPDPFLDAGMADPLTGYRTGDVVHRSWFEPVVRPGVPDDRQWYADSGLPGFREGDTFTIAVRDFLDADGHWSNARSSDDVTATLYRDGVPVLTRDGVYGDWPAAAEPAEYTLVHDLARSQPWWRHSTRTHTEWSFSSARPDDGTRDMLDLLQVDYSVDVDEHGRAVAPGPMRIGLDVHRQAEASASGPVRLSVWVAFDGGEWRQVDRVDRLGDGRFEVSYRHPRGARAVDLRVSADDGTTSIRQTVVDAYGLTGP